MGGVLTTISTVGENTTITVALTGPTAKVMALSGDAAEECYETHFTHTDGFKTDVGGELFETLYGDLTNNQKLSIIGLEVKRWLVLRAKSRFVREAKAAAAATATIESEDRY